MTTIENWCERQRHKNDLTAIDVQNFEVKILKKV